MLGRQQINQTLFFIDNLPVTLITLIVVVKCHYIVFKPHFRLGC